jgi:putative heme-binding domain-containing protein
VGPVLSGLGQRVDRSYLLESLIEPSASVVDGYQGVELSLVDGDELSGRLLEDTADSLQLQLLDGSKRDVPKSSIDSFLISSVSSMPPMGDILSTFELRDLIVYLHQNH